jgi:hypothetical protein
MSEENKAVIRRLIDEVWNRRAFDVADELFAPEAIIYESGVALPGAGPAVVKEGSERSARPNRTSAPPSMT